jgi:hypothetical protein
MPTRSNRRLLGVVAAAGGLAIISWTSHDLSSVVAIPRATAPLAASGSFDPPVRVPLEALRGRAAEIDGASRDPFSRRPRSAVLVTPAPPPLEAERVLRRVASDVPPVIAAPFKFMGILQKRTGETWGVFADCAGYTRAAREGESVLGTWRVLRIRAESAFVESLDGRRVTMPMDGCGPRSI